MELSLLTTKIISEILNQVSQLQLLVLQITVHPSLPSAFLSATGFLLSCLCFLFADIIAAAVLSGNRNFEGRVHPLTRANYLASPPLVVAYALAGTVSKPSCQSILIPIVKRTSRNCLAIDPHTPPLLTVAFSSLYFSVQSIEVVLIQPFLVN